MMLYSQFLLSKKGPFGVIWFAAHCHNRLKKKQVKQTDISSSVDKLLFDGVPIVTYRILGYLLLGVVRIYSKKVEYLFNDCWDVLSKIGDFASRENALKHLEAMHASYSTITLPERFELDAFDLEVMEYGSGTGNVRPSEDITLADALATEGVRHNSYSKYQSEEDANSWAFSASYTPVRDVFSPYLKHMVARQSDNSGIFDVNVEKLRGTRFSLEEWLEPMTFDIANGEPHFAKSSNEEHQDDGRPMSFLEEVEREPSLVKPSDGKNQTDKEQMRFPAENEGLLALAWPSFENKPTDTNMFLNNEMNFEEEECQETIRPFDKKKHITVEQTMLPDLVLPEREECQTKQGHPISITVDVATKMKFPDASGSTTPEFVSIRTPATKEHGRILRKRKCLLDDVIVVPNKVFKQCIDDASDLVCKRKKAPCTVLHAWKAQQISRLPWTFMDPLISCVPLDFRSLMCRKTSKTEERVKTGASEAPEPVKTAASKGSRDFETTEISSSLNTRLLPKNASTDKSTDAPATPVAMRDRIGCTTVDRSAEQTPIAPSTPVGHPTSMRSHELQELNRSDSFPRASSPESTERKQSLIEDQDFDVCLMSEGINSCEGDTGRNSLAPLAHKWSVRTRTVARYLHKNFVNNKKHKGDETVNLLNVLKGRTKKESARLFYEILVLKTGAYVDVRQDNPYDDIFMMCTEKIDVHFGS